MGNIGIFDGEKTRWVQFDEDTEVCIRRLSKSEVRQILNKARKTARLTGADEADVADQKVGRLAVTGWRKLGEPAHPGLIVDGKPFHFTPENTDLLMKHSLKFSRFVNEHALDEDAFDGEEDDETKNG